MGERIPTQRVKGRGALSNRAGRFARTERQADAEHLERERLERERGGELDDYDEPRRVETKLHQDASRTIIARNSSPDIPFSQSINPYRGCEHGCIYCYARTTHSYLDLSPGRDFETQIYFKPRARELLREALARPGYRVSPIALGTNTDPYQPAERELAIMRGLLELMEEVAHPVTIVTKSGLILRDLDVLGRLAEKRLVSVAISVTTLDAELKRRLEPRTAGPERRLRVIAQLAAHGVPTGVLAAPIIPALNDHELERILEASAEAGARSAGYVLLRLPHEVRPLFEEWIREHYPGRAEHVLSLVRQMREGRMNDPRFHSRQVGAGPFAGLIRARFERARRALGLDRQVALETDLFRPPGRDRAQMSLF